MIRRRVYYEGRVQGVGFRATACQVASNFIVGGTVKNLPDGRVEVVVEGSEAEVEAFLQAIDEAMGRFIRDQTQEDLPVGEPFADFRVEY